MADFGIPLTLLSSTFYRTTPEVTQNYRLLLQVHTNRFARTWPYLLLFSHDAISVNPSLGLPPIS